MIVADEEGRLRLVVRECACGKIRNLVHIVEEYVSLPQALEQGVPVRYDRRGGGEVAFRERGECLVLESGDHLVSRHEIQRGRSLARIREVAVAGIQIPFGGPDILERILGLLLLVGNNVQKVAGDNASTKAGKKDYFTECFHRCYHLNVTCRPRLNVLWVGYCMPAPPPISGSQCLNLEKVRTLTALA